MFNNLQKKVEEIISAIDLNYILAEAYREKYKVSLMYGDLVGCIKWHGEQCDLSYNYERSSGIIYEFITIHANKIIKLNISSTDNIFSLNRNMVIYFPIHIDIKKIRKECTSIVG